MADWQRKPFWWVSPSENEKVLVWVPWTGYAMAHVMKVGPEWVGTYQDRLDAVKFACDISYIRWSGHATTPNPTLRFASSCKHGMRNTNGRGFSFPPRAMLSRRWRSATEKTCHNSRETSLPIGKMERALRLSKRA